MNRAIDSVNMSIGGAYLSQLLGRQKWLKSKGVELKEGALVTLKEDNIGTSASVALKKSHDYLRLVCSTTE